MHLDESGKELRSVLVASQVSLDRLTQTIRALRAGVELPEQSSGAVRTISTDGSLTRVQFSLRKKSISSSYVFRKSVTDLLQANVRSVNMNRSMNAKHCTQTVAYMMLRSTLRMS
jgi:hypothetical protein